MMRVAVGDRLWSQVCETEIVVVRAPTDLDDDLRCGGTAMSVAAPDTAGMPDPAWVSGSQIGKRYGDDSLGIEVLVTKGGAGALSVGTRALTERAAKKLPSTD
jgi:hypothetical protein